MNAVDYQQDELYVEQVNLKVLAEQFGTPCYVYSRRALQRQVDAYNQAFKSIPHRICYAVKANSNLSILRFYQQQDYGFDIVSLGELARVLKVSSDPKKIVFSGVGKQTAEINHALAVDIGCFDVESEQELLRINALAKSANKIAKVALRINPNIHAKTHKHISTGLYANKFGIDYQNALALCIKTQLLHHIQLVGIACHIGSQITHLKPFVESLDRMLLLVKELHTAEIPLQHLNIGGGLGVRYQHEKPPSIQEYANAIIKKCAKTNLEVVIEPGRSLIANAGILLTRIEYLKTMQKKQFAIVDAGMNDLVRPALYDAWHDILPIKKSNTHPTKKYDIVGPVCESADYLGKDRSLAIAANDILAVLSAGAYGFCMSSNYNSRPRPAEVLVDGEQMILIRKREQLADLFALEC